MTHGPLLLVGGAEQRSSRGRILNAFLSLCRHPNPIVLLIDAASRRPGRMDREYARAFNDLGASHVFRPRLSRVEDADRDVFLGPVEDADAVYFAGGDQSRLVRVLHGSRGLALLIERHRAGDLVVGGTSAGAAALSETMIASGRSGFWPRRGMVDLEAGLGLAPGIVVDQHFQQRNRHGRLVEAVVRLSRERTNGVGVDENTALILHGDGALQVLGDGAVACVESAVDGHERWSEARPGDILRITGLTVSILPPGTHVAAGDVPHLSLNR